MKYNKHKIKVLVLAFSLALVATVCGRANAAELFFSGPAQAGMDQTIYLRAMISPEDFINAIEGEIRFDSRFLEFQSASTGSSVIPLWIEFPKIIHDGTIKFSGIIPGGVGPVLSKESRLFDLVFKTKSAGQTTLIFNNYKVYLNTPTAEEAATQSKSLTIDIVSVTVSEKETNKLILDFYPPEPFKIYVVKDKEFYENKRVAVFLAQDKGTGVDHYEIKESFLGLKGAWKRGESPYQLRDQNLFSIIEVKAVDKVGRERIERFVPPRVVYALVAALVILAFAIIGFAYILLRRAIRVIKKSKFGGI